MNLGHAHTTIPPQSWQLLVPNYEIVLDGPRTGGAKIRAAVASDGSFAIVYSPRGEKFTLDKSMISSQNPNEMWFDPRYGVFYILDNGDTNGIQTYTPPTSGRGCDWVFIIEDSNKQYPPPGF